MSDPLAIRSVSHSASGASVRIHPYGATILSYNNNNNHHNSCSHQQPQPPPDPQLLQQQQPQQQQQQPPDNPPPRGRPREHLFVSDTAILDGSAPIRGGIPLVFPIFGPPPPPSLPASATNDSKCISPHHTGSRSTMPQHGFARRNVWTLVREYDDPASAGMQWELGGGPPPPHKNPVSRASRGQGNGWASDDENDDDEFPKPHPRGAASGGPLYQCTLQLTVDFHGSRLTTSLTITNTSGATTTVAAATAAFPFQALLHTYYRIHGRAALDPDQCYVRGLEGYTVTDKVPVAVLSSPDTMTTTTTRLTDGGKITIASEVDRVYHPPLVDGSGTRRDTGGVHVTIGVGDNQTVAMSATAQVGGVAVPVSCVVWNPHKKKAAALADFADEHYHDMLCVEPGILLVAEDDSDGDRPVLHPGMHAVLTQVLHV